MKQNKLVVGIIPVVDFKIDETNPYKPQYKFSDIYMEQINAAGVIPIGLLLNNKKVNYDELEMCDAFIWPGGSRIDKSIYQILSYIYKTKKPLLGICLGMQGMCIFSTMLEEAKLHNKVYDKLTMEEWQELYKNMAENNPTLVKMEDPAFHDNEVTYEEYEHALHPVTFKEGSFLRSVYGFKKNVMHMHGVKANRTGLFLDVTGISEDGVTEAVESNVPDLNWVGVQFHPEFLKDDQLIKKFIERINNGK